MDKNLAKQICLAHVNYVLEDKQNNYTPDKIGEAIQLIADKSKSKVLYDYNKWRRGDLEEYPNNSAFNMKILKESVNFVS
jgi:hypothetical protein